MEQSAKPSSEDLFMMRCAGLVSAAEARFQRMVQLAGGREAWNKASRRKKAEIMFAVIREENAR